MYVVRQSSVPESLNVEERQAELSSLHRRTASLCFQQHACSLAADAAYMEEC